MNWGNKLLLVFVAFGSMMGYLVYRCFQVPVNLVSADYYKQELKYQEIIDQRENAALLSSPVELTEGNNGNWILRFPEEMKSENVNGTALLYCASDASRDQIFQLHPGTDAVQELALAQLPPGQYQLKISWNTGKANFYAEKNLSK